MKGNLWKLLVVLVVAAAVVGVVVAKNNRTARKPTASASAARNLPKLLELGSVGCTPCQKMAAITDELEREYRGKLLVEFVDVREQPEVAEKYGISTIPTQIFLDAKGKEFFRHTGVYPKADILAAFAKHGIKLGKG